MIVGVLAFAVARSTLLPGLGLWDTGEFQVVAPVLGTAHPTGYPSYRPARLAGEPGARAVRRARSADEPALRDPSRRGGRADGRAHRPPDRPDARRDGVRIAARVDPDPVARRLVRRPAHAPPRPRRGAARAARRVGDPAAERQGRTPTAGSSPPPPSTASRSATRRSSSCLLQGSPSSSSRPSPVSWAARGPAWPVRPRARRRHGARLPGAADPGRDGRTARVRSPRHGGRVLVRGPGAAVRRHHHGAVLGPRRQGPRAGRPGRRPARAARRVHPGRLRW